MRPRVAVVGTGVAGLTCTHVLRHDFDVTVFEAAPRPGGHTNTVSIALPEGEFPVDTGFIVYNEPGYRAWSACSPSSMSSRSRAT